MFSLIVSGECIGVIHCLNKKTNTKLFKQNIETFETLSAPGFAIKMLRLQKN